MLNLPIKILDKIVVDAETAAVTFSNIDTLVARWDALAHVTSRHLVLIINARSINVSESITNFLRFNGSAAMDYSKQSLSGVGGAASAGRMDGANAINLPPICGATHDYTYGGSMVLIPHAFNTVNHKSLLALGGASDFSVEIVAGRWAQAAAITSVTIFQGVGDDYVVGSEFLLGVIDERYLVEEIEDAAADFTPTFDNIPQGDGDLVVIGYLRSDNVALGDWIDHAINDDTPFGNYWAQRLYGTGDVEGANIRNDVWCAEGVGNTATAGVFSALAIIYSQYTKQNQPHFLSVSGYHESAGPGGEVYLFSGRRADIEPINKLHIYPEAGTDYKAGSLFSLYRVPKRVIQRIELTSPQATITFDNIPDYYEALILHIYARSDRVAGFDVVLFAFNGDVVIANYDRQYIRGVGAAPSAAREEDNRGWLRISDNGLGVGQYNGGTFIFPGYGKTDRHKHCIGLSGRMDQDCWLASHRWESLNAIIQIVLATNIGNFLAGSVFELEGVLRKEGLPADAGMRWG